MTPETLEALRFLAHAGDRDAQLIVHAGDVQDLIGEVDALHSIHDAIARSAGDPVPSMLAAYRMAMHDALARLDHHARVVLLAHTIGRHWREQEGVNGALLDQLAELTK